MQGIKCLKGCGASIEDIQEYCRLCLLEESEENLRARYAIILKQRTEAYKRVEEAKATAKYMDEKGKFHLNDIGLTAYSHGEYFKLGEKIGSFGYSVKKK